MYVQYLSLLMCILLKKKKNNLKIHNYGPANFFYLFCDLYIKFTAHL